LEISFCTSSIFSSFKDAEFKNLKSLVLSLYKPSHREEPRRHGFNEGLSLFFSTAKLPCLQSLSISEVSPYTGFVPETWSVAPSCAELMKSNPFSILPALNYIKIKVMSIEPECAQFLAGFYTRGGCKIDLEGVTRIRSGVLSPEYHEMLSSFGIKESAFEDAVKKSGLFKEVYCYNLVSMEELRAIAAMLFLERYTSEINNKMLEPVKKAMEVASAATQQGNEALQKRVKIASEATQRLANIINSPKVVEVDKNGASGSGGGGGR
jgi:hypothetical protein